MSREEATFIDALFNEQKELISFLREQGQISYSQNIEIFLSKTLLLSSASYFESRIQNAIADYAARISKSDEALTSLVRVKAIERQYHSYFVWREGKRSTGPFFSMFGSTFKDSARKELKEQSLSIAAEAFLELGDIRNLLVHENFASFPLEKTADEIFHLYRVGLRFVLYIEDKLGRTLAHVDPGD